MDHKVSKDMISSGMIPSGEKTQADLGRTQYGSAPSPSSLMDAYKSIYEHHQKDKDGNTIPHEDEEIKEGAGLYANIHAKRKRGGKMRKKGAKGAPSSQDFANAAKTAKEEVEMKEGIGAAVKMGLAAVKKIATSQTAKTLAKDAARGAAMQAGGSMVGGMMSGGGQQKQKTGTVSASADLFDIVKGQLLDEGLSEEEIQDIMLTLTSDEILNELSVGKMANYISAADKDVQKTADSMRKDGSVMGDDPRIKKMTNRAKGMALAGSKIAKNPVK